MSVRRSDAISTSIQYDLFCGDNQTSNLITEATGQSFSNRGRVFFLAVHLGEKHTRQSVGNQSEAKQKMLVWQDIFTDDEVMSDSFKIEPVVDGDGNEVTGLFQVQSSQVVKGGDNVDIGCGNAFGGDEEEAADDSVEKVNNIIDDSVGFGYTETGFESKSDLKTFLKSYFRKIMKHLKSNDADDEKIGQFKSDAQGIVKHLVSLYKELQFFMFRSMDSEAGMAFGYYPEGAHHPTFLYIKWGLKEVKF